MTHAELVAIAAAWLRRRGCHAVLTERGFRDEVPDAIGWLDHAVVVEAKVSRADYLADAGKPHRANPDCLGRERWYLMPTGLWSGFDPIPPPWGLLEWNGKQVRRIVAPSVQPSTVASMERARGLVIGELRAYHAQGLMYRKGAARWGLPR